MPLRLLVIVVAAAALAACRAGSPPVEVGPDPVRAAEEAARQAIATERSLDLASIPEHTVGVPPLGVRLADTAIAPLAYALADLLMTDLARSARLQVVDRVRLDALLRELTLVAAGRVDSATAPRVGRLVGARRLVIGTLAGQPGGDLTIEARIADAPTGEVRQVISARAPIGAILDAEKALAFQLFDGLGVALTPAERAAVEQRPTRNIAALLAYGRAVRHEAEGRYDLAAAQYRLAVASDPGFVLARQRLGIAESRAGVITRTSAGALRRRGQVARATGLAVDRVNRVLAVAGSQGSSGAADPSFPTDVVIVLITITTP